MQQIDLLLIEDDPGDIRLFREVLRESTFAYRLKVVQDGREALAYLRREGDYAAAAQPNIIILDLNLPLKSGKEVLEAIKTDPDLKHIPVVVLSTSDHHADIQASYHSHANCYITKPADFDKYVEVIRTVERFWFRTVQLPV